MCVAVGVHRRGPTNVIARTVHPRKLLARVELLHHRSSESRKAHHHRQSFSPALAVPPAIRDHGFQRLVVRDVTATAHQVARKAAAQRYLQSERFHEQCRQFDSATPLDTSPHRSHRPKAEWRPANAVGAEQQAASPE